MNLQMDELTLQRQHVGVKDLRKFIECTSAPFAAVENRKEKPGKDGKTQKREAGFT